MIEPIDYKALYKNEKEKMLLKVNKIKDFSLYNFLNDDTPTKIIDIREECDKIAIQEGGIIRNSVLLNSEILTYIKEQKEISIELNSKTEDPQIKFNNKEEKDDNTHNTHSTYNKTEIEENLLEKISVKINNIELTNKKALKFLSDTGCFRLVFITDDNCELSSEKYDYLRNFIQNSKFTTSKLYFIENKSYQEFIKFYSFYLITSESPTDKVLISQTNFPLSVLDGILYVGNFFNAKNLTQHKLLGIKAIIGVIDKDQDLVDNFKAGITTFYPSSEINKEDVDFIGIYKQFKLELDENCYPILIYCFSGKTLSMAACIAILMKHKNLNLIAATAVMMKVFPDLKIPVWLYGQLQRIKL